MLSTLLLLSSLSFPLPAQFAIDRVQEPKQLNQWREAYPGNWILRRNMRNQEPGLLFGSSASAPIANVQALSPAEVGELFLKEAGSFFGEGYSTFSVTETRVRPNPPTIQAATYSIFLRQLIQGVRVEGPGIQVILSGEKKLLAINSNHAKAPSRLPANGVMPDYSAIEQSLDSFEATYPGELGEILDYELVWLPDWATEIGQTKLCWRVDVVSFLDDHMHSHHRYFIDAAQAQNTPIYDFSLVNNCLEEDASPSNSMAIVGGNVTAKTREYPLGSFSTDTMPSLRIKEFGNPNQTNTDALGNFSINIPLGSGLEFYADTIESPPASPQDRVVNQITLGFKETFTLSGTGNSVLLNNAPTEETTAVYNCYIAIQDFRNFLHSLGYNDLDSKNLVAYVNDSQTVSPGNAQYSAGEMFFSVEDSGSGFQNMAFSTVIAHEMGHWLHSTTWWQGTLGNNGVQEGLSDAWAMYLFDTSVIGRNYQGNGTEVRNGVNTAQWCRLPLGCEEPHIDGMPLMGALWEIYVANQTAAKQLLPDATSFYTLPFVDERVRDIWLLTDDTDGNFANGTPNFTAIEAAFTNHGWPDFGWNAFSISHAPLPDTVVDNQAYTVSVTREINPDMGSAPSVSTWEIEYFGPNGTGTDTLLPGASANEFTAIIPAGGSPAVFEYRIYLKYSIGPEQFEVYFPESGYFNFLVGQSSSIFLNGFESPLGKDQGWTHFNIGNPSYDDWQRGFPGGSQGVSFGVSWFDPLNLPGSTNFWGTDIKATWDGAYRSDVQSYLESPDIDATDFEGLHLRLRRWISVAPGDTANIELYHPASGQSYSYPLMTINEDAWQDVNLAIPSAFDFQVFRIRFRLDSDSGNNYGGWNLDDVEVTALGASPTGTDPSNTMTLRGDSSASVGMQPGFRITGGIPNAQYELRATPLANWNPLGWQNLPDTHWFDLGPSFTVIKTGTLNAEGADQFLLSQAATQNQVGTTFCFEVVVDTGLVIEDSNIQFVKVWD